MVGVFRLSREDVMKPLQEKTVNEIRNFFSDQRRYLVQIANNKRETTKDSAITDNLSAMTTKKSGIDIIGAFLRKIKSSKDHQENILKLGELIGTLLDNYKEFVKKYKVTIPPNYYWLFSRNWFADYGNECNVFSEGITIEDAINNNHPKLPIIIDSCLNDMKTKRHKYNAEIVAVSAIIAGLVGAYCKPDRSLLSMAISVMCAAAAIFKREQELSDYYEIESFVKKVDDEYFDLQGQHIEKIRDLKKGNRSGERLG